MASSRPTFADAARAALQDEQLRSNLGFATDAIRKKRAGVVGEVPDWQDLREAARRIKSGVLADLDGYLDQLDAAVTAAGGQVHRAADARIAIPQAEGTRSLNLAVAGAIAVGEALRQLDAFPRQVGG